jgi:hypothetical protein
VDRPSDGTGAARRGLRRWLIWSALLGAVAPAIWFTLFALDALSYGPYRILTRLWPTSILLLATAGEEHTWQAYKVLSLAIAFNMALYALLGAVAWSVRRWFGLAPK